MNISQIKHLIEKTLLADEMVREISEELSLWNEANALVLLNNLEKSHNVLDDIVYSNYPKFLYWAARLHVICSEKKLGDCQNHLHIARTYIDQIKVLQNEGEEIAEAVVALEASIENNKDKPISALQMLSGLTNPYALRIQLGILINLENLDEALTLVEQSKMHMQWCDLAIVAYMTKYRFEEARAILDWLKKENDPVKYAQCVVYYTDAMLSRIQENRSVHLTAGEADLSPDAQSAVLSILEILPSVLLSVSGKGSIDSGLDEAIAKVAWRSYHLVGDHEKVSKLTSLMLTRIPIPTDVARVVLLGLFKSPMNLSDRLRDEHPEDFDAHLLATLVQVRIGEREESFIQAKLLINKADTEERKEELFRVFQQLSHELNGDAVQECERISVSLVDHNPDLQKMNNAAKALRDEDAQTAMDLLDAMSDLEDVYAIQLRGNALMQLKRTGEAAEVFHRVAKKTGNLHFFKVAADLAVEARGYVRAAECSEKIVELQPENLSARRNLAYVYISNLSDMEKAQVQFRALYAAEPNKPENAINLALSLAHIYRPEESLSIFDEACGRPDVDLQVVLGRSQLLMNLARPIEAFEALQSFRESFWGKPNFLMVFMGAAHAAGKEESAFEALSALNELRTQGQVDEKSFRALQVDDALKIVQDQVKVSQTRNEHLHKEMLQGRMPWIWAAEVNDLAFYMAWRSRTQEINWVVDDPVNRANFCIYATNGFHARADEDGHRSLLPLECPPPGGKVVADLSSLISLHRLGLLEHAASWFEEILVPQPYLQSVLEDGGKMVLRQRSQEQTATKIKQAILTGKIATFDPDPETDLEIPVVDEHDDSDRHCYRLIDLVEPVYASGGMEESVHASILKVCGKPTGVDEDHPALTLQQAVKVELISLEVLASLGVLDTLAEFYQVQVESGALREMNDRLSSIRFQEETRSWHFELWDMIREDSRFRFVPHAISTNMLEQGAKPDDLMAFLATFIARDLGFPLLADDRMCQAFVLNDTENPEPNAFGSDALVRGLSKEGRLTADSEADAFVRLIHWRYRFLVPPSRVLVNLARRYRNAAPGSVLRAISFYVHDCMRDVGLFGGAENTDQGESMAMRYYMTWATRCSEFLVAVWNDDEFSDEVAEKLTHWCVKELFPSPPRIMNRPTRALAADMTARLLISHILLNSHSVLDENRMSKGMETVQDALLLSNEEYSKIVTGVLIDAERTRTNS